MYDVVGLLEGFHIKSCFRKSSSVLLIGLNVRDTDRESGEYKGDKYPGVTYHRGREVYHIYIVGIIRV